MTARLVVAILLAFALPALGGCARLRAVPALPQRNSLVLDQLVIHSNAALPQRHRLLGELKAQRGELSAKLALPVSDEPIHVYLFPTSDELGAFLRVHFPQLPERRAFFVESDTRLTVYAYWGDRVAEDLRHEVAHGYLHAVVPRLPLWLDEGLAEYFEVPRGLAGVNRSHVEALVVELGRGWQPDIERLEQLRETGEMTQTDYAESWAWVHFLLETTAQRRQLLQAYLQSLRASAPPAPLSARLGRPGDEIGRQLTDYLQLVHEQRP
jgi:hypothetical protein